MGIFPEKDSCTDVHDGFLRRFLRARRFDLSKALAMYMTAQEWRQRESVNHLYDNFDYSRARQAFKLHYPSYIHKTDRSGSPVHIHELSKIDLSGVSSFRILRIVWALLQPVKVSVILTCTRCSDYATSFSRQLHGKKQCSTSFFCRKATCEHVFQPVLCSCARLCRREE